MHFHNKSFYIFKSFIDMEEHLLDIKRYINRNIIQDKL